MPVELPAHSKLGASSTHRWFHCPGSVAAIEALGPGSNKSSSFADDGTLAHDIAARCLKSGEDAKAYLGEADFANDAEFKEEDAAAVQVYLDAIRKEIDELGLRGTKPGQVLIEERFHLAEVHPDFFGTTDCTLIGRDQAQVWDYKHGAGIIVSVENNTQLMQYAVGALYGTEAWNVDAFPVELNICQPRVYGVEPVRSWWTSVGALKQWLVDGWLAAAARTENDPFLQPGTWCNRTFCPNRLTCPAVKEMRQRLVLIEPEELKNMDDWELSLTAQEINIVKGLGRVAEDEIFSRLRAGRPVGGFKLVRKKSDRVFKAGAPLEAEFGDKAFERKVKTPPAIEKLGPEGKKFVAMWAYKPDTGMTVAPDTDMRSGEKSRSRDDIFKGEL